MFTFQCSVIINYITYVLQQGLLRFSVFLRCLVQVCLVSVGRLRDLWRGRGLLEVHHGEGSHVVDQVLEHVHHGGLDVVERDWLVGTAA